MKKIGIITLCSNDNYGNKLQNYALKKVLENKDCEVKTIWVENSFKSNPIKAFFKYIKNKYKDYIKNYRRSKYFIKFNKLYLNLDRKKVIFNNDLKKLDRKYNYFVVGSDQVWNPKLFNNFKTYFMLDIQKEKCFSYAASLSINEIPKQLKDNYREGFNHLKCISIREDRGKELAEQIVQNSEIEVLIDPTMLLNSSDWDKIVKRPNCLKNNKYILNYFLGKLSKERKAEIERIAKENECEIINILDSNSPFYKTGPSEFLYLEKNAFLICTDSFHSSVFAILYDRPFVVFDREGNGTNMGSRIDTLIDKFKLKNRKFEGRIVYENIHHDYSEAYKILETERKKSNIFLDNALSKGNGNEG